MLIMSVCMHEKKMCLKRLYPVINSDVADSIKSLLEYREFPKDCLEIDFSSCQLQDNEARMIAQGLEKNETPVINLTGVTGLSATGIQYFRQALSNRIQVSSSLLILPQGQTEVLEKTPSDADKPLTMTLSFSTHHMFFSSDATKVLSSLPSHLTPSRSLTS